MGLLDDYAIDLDGIEAPSYDIPDDIYEFEIGDLYVRNGTDNFPDRSWIIVNYLLGDSGKSKDEWFQLPEDSSAPTEKEIEKLGYWKARLISLGVAEDAVNTVERDDLVGLTGTLVLATKNGYQNVRNVKLNEGEVAADEPAEEAAAPAAKAPARPAAKAASKAPVAAQRAAAAGVKPNPFAKG